MTDERGIRDEVDTRGIEDEIAANERRAELSRRREDDEGNALSDVVEDVVSGLTRPLVDDQLDDDEKRRRRALNDAEQR